MTAADLLTRLKAEGITPSLKLRLDGNTEPTAETLGLVRQYKGELLSLLLDAQNIPPLPWPLECLIRAASSTGLPQGAVMLKSGLVPDLGTYTLAWAAAYLLGDREQALARLWDARKVWQHDSVS